MMGFTPASTSHAVSTCFARCRLQQSHTIHSLVAGIIPVARFAASHQSALNFSSATIANLTAISKACKYEATLDKVTYPPKGKIPLPYKGRDEVQDGCELDEVFYNLGMFRSDGIAKSRGSEEV